MLARQKSLFGLRVPILLWNGVAPVLATALWWAGWGVWGLGVLASAHALWLWATLMPGSSWWGAVTTQVPGQGVWLTIDDGPDPVDTPMLLDLLEQANAKATFFFIGAKVAAHPEQVREVLRRGHEVGNHTMRHRAGMFWAMLPGQVQSEVTECSAAIRHAAPDWEGRWFRAPAGLKNQAVHPVLETQGLQLAGWSVRGYDGVASDPRRVLERLRKGLAPGAIVLMHEGRIASDGSRLAPQVLRGVLETMRERGLRSVLG